MSGGPTSIRRTYVSLMRQRGPASGTRYGDVVEVLTPVAALDPTAFDLRATLVGCLAASGANDAALAHYRSLAAAHERDLGLPARSFGELVQAVSAMR